MKNNFDFIKNRKFFLAGYAVFIAIAIVFLCIFGVDMSIDFKGGTRFSYSYTGNNINLSEAKTVVEGAIKDIKATVTQNAGYGTDSKTLVVTLLSGNSLSTEQQAAITKALTEKYKDCNIELSNSNSVSPTVAGTFFLKCLVAVIIASALVVLYVGIRFRKIGGVSASFYALLALVLDCITAFAACVIFRLELDSNFMSVILMLLGYSLNDTIVIYDRIRENNKLYPAMDLYECINKSVNQTVGRNIKTTISTLLAIVAIVIVSEFFGLSSLRSFAIPMAIGIISGAISSICLSSPYWYSYRKYALAKKAAKNASLGRGGKNNKTK